MSRKYVQLVLVTLGVIALDQWTKFLVLERLTSAFARSERPLSTFLGEAPPLGTDGYHYHPSTPVDLSQDFLRLRYAENPGAAFGLFRNLSERFRGPLFHIVSLLAVGLIGFYTTRLTGAANERWVRWGLPLVLGGALGNYADRLARGFVIDFVEAHWYESAWWPAFNVADSAITIGVGMMLIDSLVRKERAVDGPAVA
jgi:signal peptidase II